MTDVNRSQPPMQAQISQGSQTPIAHSTQDLANYLQPQHDRENKHPGHNESEMGQWDAKKKSEAKCRNNLHEAGHSVHNIVHCLPEDEPHDQTATRKKMLGM